MTRCRHECDLYDNTEHLGTISVVQYDELSVLLCAFDATRQAHRMFHTMCTYLVDQGYTCLLVAPDKQFPYQALGFEWDVSSQLMVAAISDVLLCCHELVSMDSVLV
jgi:hypothetical protein